MTYIKNYVLVSEEIATSGQPGRGDFADIAGAGYTAVVNLGTGTSPDAIPDEAQVVAGAGMAYHHIPVVWTSPGLTDLDRFFAVMDSLRGRKVWVHCVVNKRVTAFVYLYSLLRRGLPEEEARAPMDAVWEPEGVWQGFIEGAKAAAGAGLKEV
jgi:protein tyrosine phosphatase (PTP) superfamily phosphohydrolase (DUF442 family)